MATKKNQLATVETVGLGASSEGLDEPAELAHLDGIDFESDGLEDIDSSDISIPLKVFNRKGKDPSTGRAMTPDVFYDTITEQTQTEIDAVLLTMHKTREWREFDNDKNENVIHCRSLDMKHGNTKEGQQRACDGCPDQAWTTGKDGKRVRRCGEVLNFVGIERLTETPFLIRAKKTSLRPARQYLNRHFIGKRRTKKGRANMPLFAFQTHITLNLHESGNYATPVFERGAAMEREAVMICADMAKYYRDVVLPAEMDKVIAADNEGNTEVVDAEVVPGRNEFLDDGNQSNGSLNF